MNHEIRMEIRMRKPQWHYYDPAWERLFTRKLTGVVTCSEPPRVPGELYYLTWCPASYQARGYDPGPPARVGSPAIRDHEAIRDRCTLIDATEAEERSGGLFAICTDRGRHPSKVIMRGYWSETGEAPDSYLQYGPTWAAVRREFNYDDGEAVVFHPAVRRVLCDLGIVDPSLRVRFLPYVQAHHEMAETIKHKWAGDVDSWESETTDRGIEHPGFKFECPTCRERYAIKLNPATLAKLVLQRQFFENRAQGDVYLDISQPEHMEILHPVLKQRLEQMNAPGHPYQHHYTPDGDDYRF